jgi:hypothetical protein
MTQPFKARVVVKLSEEFARAVNDNGLHYTADKALAPVKKALGTIKADLHSQLRDFEYYVQSSEAHGVSDGPMINWTRDATNHPFAREKYSKLFAISVGGHKVFETEIAEKFAEALRPLVGQGVVEDVRVQTMDPDLNPKVPKNYFK